jgi:oligopeptidase B
MVCGYGSYGISYHLNTVRWKTYLEHGWAVALAFIRGGGDDTEAWADAGRREGKLGGIEDFEACIVAAQKMTGLTAKNTCIHGRSAGGYLVGACTSRHPDGNLFRAVYTEVPYVDVLRTASLPELPLTQVEYNEVGNPRSNIYDFEYLLGLSPIDTLGENGAPGVFVLSRAGTADRQVFAYEPVKWIQKLRGSTVGEKKLLYIAGGEGHFSRGDAVSLERGEDFAILQDFMNHTKIETPTIKMARKMTRRGRKGSRKARRGTRRNMRKQ